MDKKGNEKIISVYWFVVLFIVAAAIVYIVSAFYGKPYDVRELENQILTNKIADCLTINGYINENWTSFNNDNFLELCGINFNVEETNGWNDDQYYIETTILGKIVSSGNSNLKDFCSLSGENAPACLRKSLYAIDRQNNEYRIDLFSIVRKTEKNA